MHNRRHLLVACCCQLVAAVAAQGPSENIFCSEPVQGDTEYRGADLPNGQAPATSTAACCSRCRQTAGCRGWSLCEPSTEGVGTLPPMCALKSAEIDSLSPAEAAQLGAATRVTRNPLCLSGYIPPPSKDGTAASPAPPPRQPPSPAGRTVGWAPHPQTTLVGAAEIGPALEGRSLAECQQTCSNTRSCIGFVRGLRSGSCSFYPSGVATIPSQYGDSYIIIPGPVPPACPPACRLTASLSGPLPLTVRHVAHSPPTAPAAVAAAAAPSVSPWQGATAALS